MEPGIAALRVLSFVARARYSHLRIVFADVSARASASHQSVFIRDFHRLGRGDRRAHTRTNFQGWNRRGVRGSDWFRHTHHRASSRRQRRHTGDVASRPGHEHLARDARGRDHHRVLGDVSRRDASDYLHRARRLHAVAEQTNSGFARAHDLWGGLLRHAVQFCRNCARWNLGRSIVGPFLGLGPEGKWRRADRSLVRNHFARALGRVHPATRPDDHDDLR